MSYNKHRFPSARNPRTKKPYELKYSSKTAERAVKAIREFCLDLGRVPEPQPRLKKWAVGFTSSEIVFGNASDLTERGVFLIVYDFSTHEKGVTAKQLQMLLFNNIVSERVTIALMGAMVFAKDIEDNGINDVTDQLLQAEIGKVYALSHSSMELIGL